MGEPGPITRRLLAWQRQRSDLRLFRHLARHLDVDADEQQLLVAIADRHGLVRVSEIFLRPSLVTHSPEPTRWTHARVGDLRRRLFPAVNVEREPHTDRATPPDDDADPPVDPVPEPEFDPARALGH